MSLTPVVCPFCGSRLDVDPNTEAALCCYCRTPFVVEKAINNYNVQTLNASTVNVVGGATEDSLLEYAEVIAATSCDEAVAKAKQALSMNPKNHRAWKFLFDIETGYLTCAYNQRYEGVGVPYIANGLNGWVLGSAALNIDSNCAAARERQLPDGKGQYHKYTFIALEVLERVAYLFNMMEIGEFGAGFYRLQPPSWRALPTECRPQDVLPTSYYIKESRSIARSVLRNPGRAYDYLSKAISFAPPEKRQEYFNIRINYFDKARTDLRSLAICLDGVVMERLQRGACAYCGYVKPKRKLCKQCGAPTPTLIAERLAAYPIMRNGL
ncbi:MAG: hypothetical protein LBO07_01345 [Coriobacteriales bacterium]|jgi:hypothetical protein|nr:hypothetical protein [Coriobacteriales bacterium]